MRYFAGIDMGSTAIKIALMDDEGMPAGRTAAPTGSHFRKNTLAALGLLLEEEGIDRSDVAYVLSTGYGRKLFHDADETVSEITANAAGARAIAGSDAVRTIINIGGQDSKVLLLDADGQVRNFVMNDKCAAGTGRFLEMTARNLGTEVDELGDLHRRCSGAPLPVTSTCTVFAESEIISLLANGHGREEIVAGVHYSIARRIVRLARRIGIEDGVFFDGGPALNSGMVAALEDELMRKVTVPALPQFTTAIGAATLARAAWIETREQVDA
ncbi:MAG: acyl-CoA dehydratase activase [Nitrospirota bacterium]|nr:acyl-CoA dehydratase activase [Nitrospirota bacterium]